MKETILIVTMWIVTVCTYISYFPQIVKLVKTKKSEDLSTASWFLWFISSLANLVYSIILGRWELIVASVSEFLLILVTLTLTIWYNYRNNYYLESEEKFRERIDKIKSKDGNHMVIVSFMYIDRDRRIENLSKVWLFRRSTKE